MSALRDFLRSSKQQLHQSQKDKTPIVLVMGNDSADIDTIAATIIFAYFRTQSKTSSTPYIPLIQTSRSSLSSIVHLSKTLPHIGLEVADLLVLDDMSLDGTQSHLSAETTRLFLINWNELLGRQGENFSKNIEGCIDIHSDSGYVPKSTNDVRIIGRAGSCTSLVVNALRSDWERSSNNSSSKHLASLGLAGVLVPTKDLKSGATQEDESAYEFLSGNYGSDYNRNKFYTSIVGGESMPSTTSTSREPPSFTSSSAPNQAVGAGIGSIDQSRTSAGSTTNKIPDGDVHNTFTANRLDPMAHETVQSFHEEVLPEHVHGSTGVKLTGTTVGGDGYGSASGTSGYGSTSGTTGSGYGSNDYPTSSTSGTTGQSFTQKAAAAVGLGSSTTGSGYDNTSSTTGSGYGSNDYSYSTGATGPSLSEKAASAVGLGSSTTGSGYDNTSSTRGSGYGSNDYSSSTGTTTGQGQSLTEKAAAMVGLGSSTSGTTGTTGSGYGSNDYSSSTGTTDQSLSDKMASSTIGDSTTSSSGYGNTSSTSGDYSSSSRSYAPGTTSSTTTSHNDTNASSGGFMSGVLGALGLGGHSTDNTATTGSTTSGYEGEGVGQKTNLSQVDSSDRGAGHLGSDSANYGSSTSGQGLSGGYLSSSTPDYSASTTRESSSRDAGLDSHETSTGHHGSSTSGLGSSSYEDTKSDGHGLDSHDSSAGYGSSSATAQSARSTVQDKTEALVGDAQYGGDRSGAGNGVSSGAATTKGMAGEMRG